MRQLIGYTLDQERNTLTFNYTVADGDSSTDLDYVYSNPFVFNGGTIKDAALNCDKLLASPGAANSLGANKAIVIDGVLPTITAVSTTKSDGTYTTGEVIPITATFSEVVNVTGTPKITLETGDTDAVVNYTSGSESNTLTFNYTVEAGHTSTDLDLSNSNTLILSSGTIKDTAGNNLSTSISEITSTISTNSNIIIDTTVPTVTSLTST